MTRGKYAVRAANRLAEIDAGLIAELQEKLAEVTAERDAARREVERLSLERDGDARKIAERIAADAVSDLTRQLAEEKLARDEDRRRLAKGVSQVMRRRGVQAVPADWADLLDVFGLKGREMADFLGKSAGHPRRLGQLKPDDLRRAGAFRALVRGTSDAVAVKLADGGDVPIRLEEIQ